MQGKRRKEARTPSSRDRLVLTHQDYRQSAKLQAHNAVVRGTRVQLSLAPNYRTPSRLRGHAGGQFPRVHSDASVDIAPHRISWSQYWGRLAGNVAVILPTIRGGMRTRRQGQPTAGSESGIRILYPAIIPPAATPPGSLPGRIGVRTPRRAVLRCFYESCG